MTSTLKKVIFFFTGCVIWMISIQGNANSQANYLRPFIDGQKREIDLDVQREKLNEANQKIKELESGLDNRSLAVAVPGNISLTNDAASTFSAAKLLFDTLPFSESTFSKPMVLRNFIRRKRIVNKTEIVLSTHLSTHKLTRLYQQWKYWMGPASVAIYIKHEDDLLRLANFTTQNAALLRDTSFHLVMEKTNLNYPANILRNVAMEGIESVYFVAMDVDFIPLPKNCHSKLSMTMSRIPIASRTKTLFVLPAFSLLPEKGQRYANTSQVPKTKREAVSMVQKKNMEQFHQTYLPGHAPSSYPQWMRLLEDSPDFYRISVTKSESKKYEPYVLGFKPGVPRYWEDFRGFYKNKISFFTECYRAGYTYAVLTQFFCVHLDHPLIQPTAKKAQRKSNRLVWKEFNGEYLYNKYG